MRPRRADVMHSARGLSFVEVLIAVLLVATALIPAMEALAPAMQSTGIHQSQVARQFLLAGKLQSLQAIGFDKLDSEAVLLGNATTASTSYSDPAGGENRRLVYLSRYDADNADTNSNPFDGVDVGILWIKVAFEEGGSSLETLLSRYDE